MSGSSRGRPVMYKVSWANVQKPYETFYELLCWQCWVTEDKPGCEKVKVDFEFCDACGKPKGRKRKKNKNDPVQEQGLSIESPQEIQPTAQP